MRLRKEEGEKVRGEGKGKEEEEKGSKKEESWGRRAVSTKMCSRNNRASLPDALLC